VAEQTDYAVRLVADLRAGLAAQADPERAAQSQRYLKTTMPIFGVSRPIQKQLFRGLTARPPPDVRAWEEAARLAHRGPERELKYAAVAIVLGWRGRYLTLAALPLIADLVRAGAWWDLVDELAPYALGGVLVAHPDHRARVLREWIEDPDVWIRRSAVLAQLRYRDQTDADLLFSLCLRQAGDKSFWMRKAIGWALRQYARTDPTAVSAFVQAHRGELSGLSVREATKHLA
jgi:3-methyladenine DNA glycosylase AlkD